MYRANGALRHRHGKLRRGAATLRKIYIAGLAAVILAPGRDPGRGRGRRGATGIPSPGCNDAPGRWHLPACPFRILALRRGRLLNQRDVISREYLRDFVVMRGDPIIERLLPLFFALP